MPGSSLTSMGHVKPPANALYPSATTCLSPFADWMTSVPPFYRGRKRGQVVRTRTVISQAHNFQWLGSFGNRGNGRYRAELRQALAAITRYLTAYQLPQARTRLAARRAIWHRSCALRSFWLRRSSPRQRLHGARSPPRASASPPPSRSVPTADSKSDGAQPLRLRVGAGGVRGLAVPRDRGHSSEPRKKKSPVGVTRAGIVYELFFTM